MKFWHKILRLTDKAARILLAVFMTLTLTTVLFCTLAPMPGLAAPSVAPVMSIETVHLLLKINDKIVQGETSKTGMGREGAIECLSYEQMMYVPRDREGRAVARRFYAPIRIVKRIDKASTLIAKALNESQAVSAIFKFYRPSRLEPNAIEQFYTVTMEQGRIASVRQYAQNVNTPINPDNAPLEEVSFIFQKISWIYEPGGNSYQAAPQR